VRTLHHYHGIGLLTPSARSAGGYRLYSETDLQRLRQVLFYRQLDFGLDEIAEILADAATGTDDHLRGQHRLLRERRARDKALLRAIEKEMEARAMGISLTPEEQFEIFGTDKLGEYAEEAKQVRQPARGRCKIEWNLRFRHVDRQYNAARRAGSSAAHGQPTSRAGTRPTRRWP
jgi:DNA-binding transcriptional MerR regulator